MDGKPVKVPQNPTRNGDVLDYIPGAKLEFRKAMNDAAYQVRAIKVGDVLIADRVLLRSISWVDLAGEGRKEVLLRSRFPKKSSEHRNTWDSNRCPRYCRQGLFVLSVS